MADKSYRMYFVCVIHSIWKFWSSLAMVRPRFVWLGAQINLSYLNLSIESISINSVCVSGFSAEMFGFCFLARLWPIKVICCPEQILKLKQVRRVDKLWLQMMIPFRYLPPTQKCASLFELRCRLCYKRFWLLLKFVHSFRFEIISSQFEVGRCGIYSVRIIGFRLPTHFLTPKGLFRALVCRYLNR